MKTSKKAPVVAPLSKKNPNFMKENSGKSKGKSPFAPMTAKKLSK